MTDAEAAARPLDRVPERALARVHEVEDDAEPGDALDELAPQV